MRRTLVSTSGKNLYFRIRKAMEKPKTMQSRHN